MIGLAEGFKNPKTTEPTRTKHTPKKLDSIDRLILKKECADEIQLIYEWDGNNKWKCPECEAENPIDSSECRACHFRDW